MDKKTIELQKEISHADGTRSTHHISWHGDWKSARAEAKALQVSKAGPLYILTEQQNPKNLKSKGRNAHEQDHRNNGQSERT